MSPLIAMDKVMRTDVANLMRRALSNGPDLTEDKVSKVTESKMTSGVAQVVPTESDDPGIRLEDALRCWCKAVLGVCMWAALDKFRDDTMVSL